MTKSKVYMRRGGRILRSGYWYRKVYGHPRGGKQNYVAEHRLVMEEFLGRYLKPSEVVHHKDGNRRNNNLENLELFSSHGQHTKHCHPEAYERARRASLGRKPANWNRANKDCPSCGQTFETTLGSSGKKFCSRPCFWKASKGDRRSPETEFKKGMTPWNKQA